MEILSNKTILLISPQSWGKMFISKHHYAIELAKMGNTVYFLNPPDEKKIKRSKKILVEHSGQHPNLFIIHHRLSFPYDIKFHFISLFHKLMKPHMKKIMRHIGKPVDIVWSFDLGNLYPFHLFSKNTLKIFHPVDEPLNQTAIQSAHGADVLFGVTKEILDKYRHLHLPKHCINHGVSEEFLVAIEPPADITPLRVGLSGNLLRSDIDHAILLKIIRENREIIFECWGAYQVKSSNIGGEETDSLRRFIEALQEAPNVILHGAVASSALPKEFQRMHAFLICYDVLKDQSKGTNYHKVIEYISTGRVTVANNISAYYLMPEFVTMVSARTHNEELPGLFKKVIQDLSHYNSQHFFTLRREYAMDNSYLKQIARIGCILKDLQPNTGKTLVSQPH